MLWQCAYVGIGSNLDDPAQQVQRALQALAGLERTRLMAQSSLYGSRPWGMPDQPDFVNAVAALLTRQTVEEFFAQLRSLEQQLGRAPPTVRWGPRRIDLDLLVFDQLQLDSPELQLPHPGVVSRNFVLYPLSEVAPDLALPGGARVSELRARVDATGIWRLDDYSDKHGV
jgi:2-amino-4-hydroxy-6-hydroxymethyldihydropteridine diphosphokinase